MDSRLNLQADLESLLRSRNVYFQPPESIKMNYPAIVYALESIKNLRANGGVYLSNRKYKVILIDPDPDSEFVELLNKLPHCKFITHYTSNNLNHFVYSLYY